MQAATPLVATPLPLKSTKKLATRSLPTPRRTILYQPAFARATPTADTSTVDYSSSASVFPAEACETLGGEACDVEMFPEVKPVKQPTVAKATAVEEVDREYIDYNESRTVFPGEACDDLGGEFCEPEYQQGVHALHK